MTKYRIWHWIEWPERCYSETDSYRKAKELEQYYKELGFRTELERV